jgi:tetratricopeptide (TPR) repeat protein
MGKSRTMRASRSIYIYGILAISVMISCVRHKNQPVVAEEFSGSGSCIQCHERFYELWSTSHHGKAMQPVNTQFLNEENLPPSEEFTLEGKTYRVTKGDSMLIMMETDGGTTKEFLVSWALGGKNVFYFLTPMEQGKLQTIPLAFDVRTQKWYNNPESAVRHFPEGTPDEALPWRDRMYTFNTSCYSCHVSQLATNFDLASDSYQTTWKEPGINCETCHGPSAEHVRVCMEAGEGNVPDDLKIIITSTFTPEQHNSSCAPCHAKMQPITASFMPGELYFNNYDLTTLENADFYADGRDLGENYTYTSWMMNECAQKSDIHCVTCHTSSGRDRFATNPNDACIACHRSNVENVAEHSMHPAGSEGAVCINCHMPKTEFGRMVRSDHSFRPPMPEATIKFESPNACNICHTDKSPEWANQQVKKRVNKNYQDETLYWAQLIKEARAGEWKRLDEMLAVIGKDEKNEVVVTSLLRLLVNCPDEKKWDVVIQAVNNKSTLVRAAAAASLTGNSSEKAKKALLAAAADEFRLVRVSAAQSLAGFAHTQFTPVESQTLTEATNEYLGSLVTRPDDWSSHYNEGIFHQNRGDAGKALNSYETAARLYPESLMPLINSSVLYSYTGNHQKAEENLRKAVDIDPSSEAANLNLGLLLAEQGRIQEAENALKAALSTNPKQAVAAYNLSVISSQRSMEEAVRYSLIATEANTQEPKYAWTLAYYQLQNNQQNEAEKTLKKLIADHPLYLNAVSMLADIYMRKGDTSQLRALYMQTLKTEGIPEQDRRAIQQALQALGSL